MLCDWLCMIVMLSHFRIDPEVQWWGLQAPLRKRRWHSWWFFPVEVHGGFFPPEGNTTPKIVTFCPGNSRLCWSLEVEDNLLNRLFVDMTLHCFSLSLAMLQNRPGTNKSRELWSYVALRDPLSKASWNNTVPQMQPPKKSKTKIRVSKRGCLF